MKNYNHINSIFDSMIDDVKYIKVASFVRKVNAKKSVLKM